MRGDGFEVVLGGVVANGFEAGHFGLGGGVGGGVASRGGFEGGETDAGFADEAAMLHADGFVGGVEFFDGGGLGGGEVELDLHPRHFVGLGVRVREPAGEAEGERGDDERQQEEAGERFHECECGAGASAVIWSGSMERT